jgi:hypothetical protein
MPTTDPTEDPISAALRPLRAATAATLRLAKKIKESNQSPDKHTLDSLEAAAGCAHYALHDLEAILLDLNSKRS